MLRKSVALSMTDSQRSQRLLLLAQSQAAAGLNSQAVETSLAAEMAAGRAGDEIGRAAAQVERSNCLRFLGQAAPAQALVDEAIAALERHPPALDS